MDLEEYLWRHRKEISRFKFAKKIQISELTLHRIIHRKQDVRLSVAMKIIKFTNKEVTFEELLPKNWEKNKKENEEKEKDSA